MQIPFFDAQREFAVHADEYLAAAERVLTSGRYILGPEVEAFEQEAADYLGAAHAIGCASGTDALWLALKAAGVGPGDGVVTPAVTFFATASAILNVGAIPVVCDVDAATYNLDPQSVRTLLEGTSEAHTRVGVDPKRIKTIVPVHLYGQPADMDELNELARAHDVRVIEDAAQAFGAEYRGRKVGTSGDIGCFSFFPTKNLGGFGDGGLVTTNDDTAARRLRMLRNHGGTSKYSNEIVGTNSRLDALQAALLRVRLAHIQEVLDGRSELADRYDAALAGSDIGCPERAPYRTHSFCVYAVRVADRERVRSSLAEAEVEAITHNGLPIHLQPAIGLGYLAGDFPHAEHACNELLSLPTSPRLTSEEIGRVTGALLAATTADSSVVPRQPTAP